MVWVASTDPVDSFWYYDCTRFVDLVERPCWIGAERVSGTGLPRLYWTTAPGRRYRVDGRSSHADTWVSLDEVTASGSETGWTDPAPPATMRVYRVSVLER
jgi:hypothetical protein